MSASFPNLTNLSIPFSPERKTPAAGSFNQAGFPPNAEGKRCRTLKAKALSERRDNLDYLQRANNRQPAQGRQKSAQVPTVGLWERLPAARTVQQMMDTMERMMEDPLRYPSLTEENVGGVHRRGRTPWEIMEVESEYKLRFDMPGMTKKDVKVCVEEKTLLVKAEKREEEGEWPAKSYGKYSSRIALPDNIDMGKIKAEVRDGVLYVAIPKAEDTRNVLDIQVQ